jgi:amidohydrolase
MDWRTWISEKELLAEVESARELRHELHRWPELAYGEHETMARLEEYFSSEPGIELETGVAGTGMVVTIGGDKAGPCVALRADMDALPLEDRSGKAWASRVPGKHHGCGHDGHMAMLAGAGRLLARHAEGLAGPVKLIFQPAEEGGGGGKRMCEAGVLRAPDVAAVYGLHNNLPGPDAKFGKIAYARGAAMAGTGTFDIRVVGQGGHAAFPHLCVDPLAIGAAIVEQLQRLVARELDPLASGVVTVTKFHAGTAMNIIAADAMLSGTFRALDVRVLEQLRDRIVEVSSAVAAAHRARVEVRCDIGYPVLVNDERAQAAFIRIAERTGHAERLEQVAPIMGGEDFAFYGQQVPAFFYFLPACPADQARVPMCHDPMFDFNDDLLPLGIGLHLAVGYWFGRIWRA